MRRMDKLSDNKAFALLSVTRRRTKVRRAEKFVHSIKHYFFCFVFYYSYAIKYCFGVLKSLYILGFMRSTLFLQPLLNVHKRICNIRKINIYHIPLLIISVKAHNQTDSKIYAKI